MAFSCSSHRPNPRMLCEGADGIDPEAPRAAMQGIAVDVTGVSNDRQDP
jgi:hypothetical protein